MPKVNQIAADQTLSDSGAADDRPETQISKKSEYVKIFLKFFNLCNAFLLIGSIGLLFTSGYLMSFYHMTKVRGPLPVFNKQNLYSLHSCLGISTPCPCPCWSLVSTHSPCHYIGFSSQPESPSKKAESLSLLNNNWVFKNLQGRHLSPCCLPQYRIPRSDLQYRYCNRAFKTTKPHFR